jgi:hypothetical protein
MARLGTGPAALRAAVWASGEIVHSSATSLQIDHCECDIAATATLYSLADLRHGPRVRGTARFSMGPLIPWDSMSIIAPRGGDLSAVDGKNSSNISTPLHVPIILLQVRSCSAPGSGSPSSREDSALQRVNEWLKTDPDLT